MSEKNNISEIEEKEIQQIRYSCFWCLPCSVAFSLALCNEFAKDRGGKGTKQGCGCG